MPVKNIADAAAWADVVMILTPDELQKDIYNADIASEYSRGWNADVCAWSVHSLSASFKRAPTLMCQWLHRKVRATRCAVNMRKAAVCRAS